MTALFQSGADVPLSYAFNTATGTLPAGLTSGGVALSYVDRGEPDHGDGRAGSTVFTMALDASTGAWTFTLSGRSTMPMTAPTPRTTSPSTSAAWCRRPTATATR